MEVDTEQKLYVSGRCTKGEKEKKKMRVGHEIWVQCMFESNV